MTGGVLVAETKDRWDFLRADYARQRTFGADVELISPAQIRELCPIMDVSRLLGGIYDPREGHLDPFGATHAFAKAARLKGAEIYRHTRVESIRRSAKDTWLVNTNQGAIECEHVVNAGGLWAREVGHMVGVDLPLVPMEHHYLISGNLPELEQMQKEVPGILDLDGEIYLRQEHNGMLIGVYEKDATPWAVNGTPWEWGESELLPPNLDRLGETLEKGFQRFPSLMNAGIKRIVNGPFTFTPDGNPLVGPVPGLRNYWAACGVMAGFSQGGGVGLTVARWLLNGEPDGDVYAMDIGRFGSHTTRPYVVEKAREFYSRRFQIAYPNEYWPAGRPSKKSAVHPILEKANAVFGVSFGLEYPCYFAPEGEPAVETPTLRRSNAFPCVAEECRTARSGVGILDISSFAKYEVTGPRAEAALNTVLASRLPAIGHIRVTPMLAHSGRLMGDLTTMRLAEDRFLVGGSGYLQTWHMRWFASYLAREGVHIHNVSDHFGGLALIGPQSRELLARIAAAKLPNEVLPFMGVASMDLGFAPSIVGRLSVTGELGYEIYVPTVYLPALLETVIARSEGLSARYIGMHALNSLRLEKGFGIWSREFSRDYTPRMSGLDRFVEYGKPDFIGRDAALRDRESPPSRKLVTLAIDANDADAAGYEPIHLGDRVIGFVTSGGYGHCSETSLAMGYVDTESLASNGLSVSILGQSRPCRILSVPLVDPAGARMRS
jgi:dimethylglycine dehydrogenase